MARCVPPILPIFGRDFRQSGRAAAEISVPAPIDDAIPVEILIDEPMEPEPVSFAVANGSNGVAHALRRCAAGEISPELALSQLLSPAPAEHDIEAALGAAIWDALESRATISVVRLADLQRLWNQRRVQQDLHSL